MLHQTLAKDASAVLRAATYETRRKGSAARAEGERPGVVVAVLDMVNTGLGGLLRQELCAYHRDSGRRNGRLGLMV